MLDSSKYKRIVVDCYRFPGLFNCPSCCALEILSQPDHRVVVIATQLDSNHGTSITNAVEQLASHVCTDFHIDPLHLVWIELYRFAPPEGDQYDRVWLKFLPQGDKILFVDPRWRRMDAAAWHALGLEPRE